MRQHIKLDDPPLRAIPAAANSTAPARSDSQPNGQIRSDKILSTGCRNGECARPRICRTSKTTGRLFGISYRTMSDMAPAISDRGKTQLRSHRRSCRRPAQIDTRLRHVTAPVAYIARPTADCHQLGPVTACATPRGNPKARARSDSSCSAFCNAARNRIKGKIRQIRSDSRDNRDDCCCTAIVTGNQADIQDCRNSRCRRC